VRTRSLKQEILIATVLAAVGAAALFVSGVARPPAERAAAAPDVRSKHPGDVHGALAEFRNLEQLVEEAGVIVRGRVAAAREERHPELEHMDTVVITLAVTDTMKGSVGSEYTFRQFIPNREDEGTLLGYKVGMDLVLLLTRPSRYGFSSPAGLMQGVFRVEVDAENRAWVRNGMDNMGLFEGMRERVIGARGELDALTYDRLVAHREGPMLYDDFRSALRILGAGSTRRVQ
jgi:hypothetical protein